MPSPFPLSNLPPGTGHVHLSLLPPGQPHFRTLLYTYPLKLLPSAPHTIPSPPPPPPPPPSSHNQTPQRPHPPHRSTTPPLSVPLLFLLSYSGGLLPPDALRLTLTLDPNTRLVIATQGATKIYPSPPPAPVGQCRSQDLPPAVVATQELRARIARGAGLWLGLDPACPFRGSWYESRTVVEVEEGGSVGWVEWVGEGRGARGESWVMGGWRGVGEVWRVGSDCGTEDSQREGVNGGNGGTERWLVLRDRVVLERGWQEEKVRGVEELGVVGTIVLVGPLMEGLGEFFVEEFAALPKIGKGGGGWGGVANGGWDQEEGKGKREQWREERLRVERVDGVLWSAARVRGCVVVKFGAGSVDGGRRWLGAMLREEGSVGNEFGEGGLMFVR